MTGGNPAMRFRVLAARGDRRVRIIGANVGANPVPVAISFGDYRLRPVRFVAAPQRVTTMAALLDVPFPADYPPQEWSTGIIASAARD